MSSHSLGKTAVSQKGSDRSEPKQWPSFFVFAGEKGGKVGRRGSGGWGFNVGFWTHLAVSEKLGVWDHFFLAAASSEDAQ